MAPQDAEQRPGVIVTLRLFQTVRVFQKRGTWREEHRTGAQRRVDHRVGRVLALPRLDKGLDGAAHLLRDVVQGQGIGAKGCAHEGFQVRSGPLL
jgi:hypothetical protein